MEFEESKMNLLIDAIDIAQSKEPTLPTGHHKRKLRPIDQLPEDLKSFGFLSKVKKTPSSDHIQTLQDYYPSKAGPISLDYVSLTCGYPKTSSTVAIHPSLTQYGISAEEIEYKKMSIVDFDKAVLARRKRKERSIPSYDGLSQGKRTTVPWKRAKSLTLDILHQLFYELQICRTVEGSYKVSFQLLKEHPESIKYFATTDWPCFRKRIINHGFHIIEEQTHAWLVVQPCMYHTKDDRLVFDYPDLREAFGTPHRLRRAKDKGLLYEQFHHKMVICRPKKSNLELSLMESFKTLFPTIIQNLVERDHVTIEVDGFEITMNLKKSS